MQCYTTVAWIFFQITRCLSFCQSDCPEVRYDDPPVCGFLHWRYRLTRDVLGEIPSGNKKSVLIFTGKNRKNVVFSLRGFIKNDILQGSKMEPFFAIVDLTYPLLTIISNLFKVHIFWERRNNLKKYPKYLN